MTKKRILSYDVIRIVAALAVVMVHIAEPFISRTEIGSAEYVTGNVFGAASRIGVQMFVMLSGALTLREEREYTFVTMRRSIGNLLFLLAVWSFVYAVVQPLSFGYELSFEVAVERFFTGHFHLWYLFMLIGLHLITPILRTFVKKENKKYVGYYILLAAIFTFAAPLLQFFYTELGGNKEWIATYPRKFQIGILGNYIAYYLLGWYLTTVELTKKARYLIYGAGALGFAVTVGGSLYYSEGSVRASEVFFHNFTLNVMLMSVAVFVFLLYLLRERQISALWTKVITRLSGLTFGVYVLHLYVMSLLARMIPDLFAFGTLSAPALVLCRWMATVVVSFLAVYLLSKIPIVKQTVKS